MKKTSSLLIILAAGAGLVLSAETVEVSISGFVYSPSSITIMEGDSVRWTNSDNTGHTTTSGKNGLADGMWDSGLLSNSGSFTQVFNSSGIYPYFCRPHPWMIGDIIVEAKSDTTDTTEVPAIYEDDKPRTLSLDIKASHLLFSLPSPGKLNLTIYDSIGRETALLANKTYDSGIHEIAVPDLKQGIYFARLRFSDRILTRKLIKYR